MRQAGKYRRLRAERPFEDGWRMMCLCVLLLLIAYRVEPVQGEDWPQFRGPNCTGLSRASKPLPVKFSAQENVRWSVALGDGIGSPVVAEGRVFTSAMVDERTIGLFAFDSATGERLWQKTWPTGTLPEIHKTNSHAVTTPATDGERVYFYFSTLGLLALDAKTGDDIWRVKLPVPYFVFKWGPGMSPILHKDKIIFCQDDDLNPALYAIDKRTGEILWKDDRSDMAVNYSHPVICETESGEEIVVAGTGMLIGYDPATGKRLWHARVLLRNIKTTPVTHNGILYIALQSGGIANQWLATADRDKTGNSDGKLTKAEMQAFVGQRKIPEAFFQRTFDRGDANQDGVLEGEELDRAFLHPDNFAGAHFDDPNPADEFILAVRGGGRGDVTETHLLWKHQTRHTDHIVSPLVLDGRMLLVKGGGIATCFDTRTGDALWGPRRIQNAGAYFASPVYGDGKIYVTGENGTVVVLKNGPQLEILAKNNLGDAILATPALAEGRLFFRTRNRLICVGESSEAH